MKYLLFLLLILFLIDQTAYYYHYEKISMENFEYIIFGAKTLPPVILFAALINFAFTSKNID